MKRAIAQLEEQLKKQLDQFCLCTENGNYDCAARASEIADDFAEALSVLKVADYGFDVDEVRRPLL